MELIYYRILLGASLLTRASCLPAIIHHSVYIVASLSLTYIASLTYQRTARQAIRTTTTSVTSGIMVDTSAYLPYMGADAKSRVETKSLSVRGQENGEHGASNIVQSFVWDCCGMIGQKLCRARDVRGFGGSGEVIRLRPRGSRRLCMGLWSPRRQG